MSVFPSTRSFKSKLREIYPEATVRFGPLGFRCVIKQDGRVLAEERGNALSLALVRVLIWAGLPAIVLIPFGLELVARAEGFPSGLALLGGLALLSIVGHAACGWVALQAPQQWCLTPLQVARQQKRSRSQLVASLARAYWGSVWQTPWPARLIDWWPWAWFSYGNRPVKMTKEAICGALDYLSECNRDDLSSFSKQLMVDQYLDGAMAFASQAASRWPRCMRFQETFYILGSMIGGGGFLLRGISILLS